MPQKLHDLAECMNETHYKNYSNGGFGSAQPPQSPRSLSEAEGSEVEGSEVEGSTTHKQAEGQEISGLKAYE